VSSEVGGIDSGSHSVAGVYIKDFHPSGSAATMIISFLMVTVTVTTPLLVVITEALTEF
jgi:hypothetical protein